MDEELVNDKGIIRPLLVLFLFISFFIWSNWSIKKKIKEDDSIFYQNGLVAKGVVTDVEYYSKGGDKVYYLFYTPNYRVKGFDRVNKKYHRHRPYFKGDSCYIFYAKDRIKFNRIILEKELHLFPQTRDLDFPE